MLTPEDGRRAEKLFDALLELSPAEREAFIARECAAEPELAAEVRQLLAHYEAAPPEFLQSPAGEPGRAQALDSIGPYDLKEVLGEGGMGVVYRAEQREPVVRTVALKILKLGMDSREILARFEGERQALARLEHPNIARVYDAGTTLDGRPYFVMEYVQGQPITTYCDAHRLTPRQRIELFIGLCRGVQYAHQQGIIHRDLKPMNILVAEHDGVAQAKVIDFGVAKAVRQGLDGTTLFTQLGQLVGTLEYMSPEQAEAAPVDTRTDVYSLGAVLYELLVGVLPIDAATLREAGISAMMRLIREQEPPRPSTRAKTLAGSSALVADRRSVAPRTLTRTLRGELDWIALKALEKDRDRRYGTVAELAADLQRHLVDEPVSARPASSWYLLRKFVRRHRVGVALAGTIVGAVAVLAVSMTVQASRIARERDRANHEADVARQVKDFLVDIFYVSDPEEAQGSDISAREILNRSATRVDELEDVAVRAELSGTLGAVYHNLGLYGQSDSLYLQAKDLWLMSKGPDHPATLQACGDVANSYKALGRYAEAESLFTAAIDGWRRLGLADDRRALDAASRLANTYRAQHRYESAEALYLETLASWRLLEGDDGLEVLRTRNNLAFCYSTQGRYDEAAAICEDVLPRMRRVAGDDSPRTFRVIDTLGEIYRKQERYDEAEVLMREALAGRRKVLGVDHPNYLRGLESLASLKFSLEDHAEAERLFQEVLAGRRRTLGAEHPSTVVAMHNVAAAQSELGRQEEALDLGAEVLRIRLKILGEDHPYTQGTRHMLAMIQADLGDYDQALEHLRIAVEHGFAHEILLSQESLAVLEPLRGRPEFEALLDTVRTRLQK